MSTGKPYRPNVGIALFNVSGQVLIGRRFRDDGPEIILPGLEWQMPQGGIDAQENPREAVMRELWEETGVVSADYSAKPTGSLTSFRPMTGRHHIAWQNFAASGRNGSRCASPGATMKSIR
jgi:putative (di)nucleoside polyphosphate hydrolase